MTLTTGTTVTTDTSIDTEAIIAVQSREILYQAQPILRIAQFATEKTELNTMPGQTINFMRWNSFDPSTVTALTEGTPMDTYKMTAQTVSITVSEYGFATAFSEKLMHATFADIASDAAKLLGMNYAMDLDRRARNTLRTTLNVKYAGSATSVATIAAGDTFDMTLVRDTVELLATNKCPKINGDAYICFLHPRQARYMREDPNWVNASNYGDPSRIFKGEIGRIEDVRFIETTMVVKIDTSGNLITDGTDAGETNTGTPAVNVYEALMIGDHAFGHAISNPVEMRDDGVNDFGRTHKLGWYTIDGFGLIETGHSVRMYSA